MKDQARAMGASAADIEKLGLNDQEAIAKEGILLLEPNIPVFNLFMNCASQWNTVISPAGRLIKTGLSWPDVEARARHMPEIRALDEAKTDRLWRDLTTLQNHALSCMAELREHEKR